ncbi:MAG: DUF2203 domain-containing protein [Gemmatimonadales bacterium]
MTTTRIFTVEEADRAIPLLKRILSDLRVEYDIFREAEASYELLAAGSRADIGETEALVESRTALTESAERVDLLRQELESIGCVFRGFEAELVDFYALRDDRLVFLCWKFGEERISHWHEVDAGFPGRQPVYPNEFSAILP